MKGSIDTVSIKKTFLATAVYKMKGFSKVLMYKIQLSNENTT